MYSTVGKDDWRPLLGSNFREQYGAFSPDGKWVAYQSNEAGAQEIWVTDFPGGRQKHRISEHGGREPRWRADGQELFYASGDDMLMAAAIGPDFGSVRSRPVVSRGSFSGERGLALRGDERRAEVSRAGRTARPDRGR